VKGKATQHHSGARMLIIGIDGATFRLMQPLIDAGKLPTIGRLIARGTSGVLESIIPPNTAPAWPSMMMGKNPGKHGILFFDRCDIRNYACYSGLVTSDAIAGQTWFDLLSKRDLRVAAVRVPMTYPAWQINGVMVSGLPATGISDRYTYPAELMKRIPPMLALKVHGNTPEGVLHELEHEIDVTTQATCDLLAQERWDLMMLVYQQTDYAHHAFWRYIDPESVLYTPEDAIRYGHLMSACYERVDADIARILAQVDEDTTVLVVSDHGGERSPNTYFYTNRWLLSLGLLAPKSAHPSVSYRLYERRRIIPKDLRMRLVQFVNMRLPSSIRNRMRNFMTHTDQYDWSQTRAYRFPVYEQMEGIAINLCGRQPQGIVEPGAEYERLRDEIIAHLRALRIPGTDEPLVVEVFKREAVFHGPYVERMPDIVFRLAFDYEGTGKHGLQGPLFGPVPPRARELHSAWHDRQGIFIMAGPQVRAGARLEHAHLLDVAPTVLHALGLPIPADMDGRVLEEVFAVRQEQRHEAASAVTIATGAPLSAAEEEDMKSRLRNLGYL